jgi:hypothetical protein
LRRLLPTLRAVARSGGVGSWVPAVVWAVGAGSDGGGWSSARRSCHPALVIRPASSCSQGWGAGAGPIACRLSFVVPAILCGRCSSSPISHRRHCSRSVDRVVCRPPIPIICHSPSPPLSFIYPRPSHSLPLVLVLESSYCRTLSHTSSSTRGAGRNAAVGRVASVGLYHIEVRT